MAIQSNIKGVIKVNGIPDSACFTTFAELLKSLGTYLSVEIPNQSFSNVVISVAQPGQADRDKLWVRLSGSGSFVGFFLYNGSVWVQILPPPNQIVWMYGDSEDVAEGYSFDLVQTLFSAPDYAALIAQAIPAGPGPYSYFPVIFVGT